MGSIHNNKPVVTGWLAQALLFRPAPVLIHSRSVRPRSGARGGIRESIQICPLVCGADVARASRPWMVTAKMAVPPRTGHERALLNKGPFVNPGLTTRRYGIFAPRLGGRLERFVAGGEATTATAGGRRCRERRQGARTTAGETPALPTQAGCLHHSGQGCPRSA